MRRVPLTAPERATYEWQMWVPGFGEAGQEKLKAASVLVSRCGGVGGIVAYELAAAGIGRLVLAHGGDVKPSDLNRQLLMTHDAVGSSRMASAVTRLSALNPRLEIEPVPENISQANASRLVSTVDLVVDCAPLFEERFLMNREAVRHGKPLVECAMYDFDVELTSIVPGETPCLGCLYPDRPDAWRREFPVFGAVAGATGCLAAVEAIKLLSGLGSPLKGQMLVGDLRDMTFHRYTIERRPGCQVCGGL